MARYPYRSVEETSSAMSALQASYGRDHPSYASTLSATAKLMARNPGEQIAMMREALATLRRTVAPQSELISAAKSNLGKDLLALPGRLRTAQDVAEGTRLLREVVVEKHRRGAPAPVEQMHLINNALGFAEARQLADTQALLEQSRLETRRYFQPSDAVSRDLDHMADRLLYRQGQRARADRNFAARLQANREFMRTAVAGRSGNEYRLSVILGQSLIYRALYAFEQCRKDEARAYLRQAVDFDRRALGIDDPATATAQSFLDNLFERGQMHDDTDGRMLYPDDLDRLNRQARDCGR
jgi:tetratricopeptide (TPR) repeat protein